MSKADMLERIVFTPLGDLRLSLFSPADKLVNMVSRSTFLNFITQSFLGLSANLGMLIHATFSKINYYSSLYMELPSEATTVSICSSSFLIKNCFFLYGLLLLICSFQQYLLTVSCTKNIIRLFSNSPSRLE